MLRIYILKVKKFRKYNEGKSKNIEHEEDSVNMSKFCIPYLWYIPQFLNFFYLAYKENAAAIPKKAPK